MNSQGDRPAKLDVMNAPDPAQGATVRSAHSVNAGASEQAFFRLDLMRSLQLHRRIALSFAAVGLVLGVLYYLTKAPVYETQCIIYVQPAPPSVIQQGFSSRWPYDSTTYDSYIQQQITNAMREDVLTNALKKLGTVRKPNESDEDVLNRLKGQLSVWRVGQSYQFYIQARASTAELAARTANTVAASYLESLASDQKAGDRQRLTMLREERDRVQSALDADRSEQQELNKQLGVASVGGAPDHFDQDITEVRTELVKARTEHDAAEARFTAMGANHGESSNAIDAAADSTADMDAGLVSMKTALNGRKAVLISKMANLTPSNPEYKQDAAELGQINANLEQMMKDLRARAASRIQLQLRSDLERTAGVEAQINSQLRQLVSNATNATSKLQRASDLAADITRLQSRYSAVDEQLHNLMLEDAAPTGAYISTPADVPNHRAKTGRTKNALAIVMAGAFLGLIVAVIRHKLDRHVYVGSDIENILGYGPMALLPDFGEVSEGAAEEHLLRLAAAIEHAQKQGHLRSCVFTSTNSGTGVTTIVTRVRALLEAMGKPTLYVDASGTSKEEESVGSEGLLGTKALVSAGRNGRQTAVSLQLADEADNQALVLTDAAPIAVSAETEYLVRFADCAIVVVESGVTTRAEIREVATTLQRLNVGAVGFVLNRVGMAKADPAFRSSVEAVEKHLQSQMGVVARRTRRTEAVVVNTGSNHPVNPAPADSGIPASAAVPQSAGTPLSTSQMERSESSEPVEAIAQTPVSSPAAAAANPPFSAIPAEPLFTKTWTQPESPSVAPANPAAIKPLEDAPAAAAASTPVDQVFAASIPTQPIETPFSAPLSSTPPWPSNESSTQRGADWISSQEPYSYATFAAPQVPRVDPQTSPDSVYARYWGASATPAQPTFDPAREEQVREAVRANSQVSESPAVPAPVVHQSMWAQRERLTVPAQREAPIKSEPASVPVAATPSAKPVEERDSDIPWWLSEVPVQLAEMPAPLLWQGDVAGRSRKDAGHLAPDPVEFPLHADPSRNKRAGLPVQPPLSERGAGMAVRPAAPPAQSPAYVPVQEDAPERMTSRLSGLRSLLTGLGLKENHPPVGTADPDNPNRMSPGRGSAAAEGSRRGSPNGTQASPTPGQPAAPGSRASTAQPEFLKPATSIAEYQSGDPKPGEKPSVRNFKSGGEFEIPTLPSKRGQYRNL